MKPDKKRKSAAFDPIDIHVGKRVKMLRTLLYPTQAASEAALFGATENDPNLLVIIPKPPLALPHR